MYIRHRPEPLKTAARLVAGQPEKESKQQAFAYAELWHQRQGTFGMLAVEVPGQVC